MIRLVANGLLCAALFSLAMRPWGHGLFALVAASLLGASLMRERSLWRGGLLAGIAWLGLGIPALEGVSARLWWGFPALLVVLASGWVLAGVVVIHVSRRAGERAGWMAFVLAFTAAEFALSRRWVVGDAAVIAPRIVCKLDGSAIFS